MNFGVITLNQSIKTMQNYVIWILAKFNEFANAFGLLDKIRDGKISLTDARNDQAEFKSNVSEIKKGDKKHRSKEQKNTLHNIEMLYKTRNSVVEFFDNYSSIVSKANFKATKYYLLIKCFKDYL